MQRKFDHIYIVSISVAGLSLSSRFSVLVHLRNPLRCYRDFRPRCRSSSHGTTVLSIATLLPAAGRDIVSRRAESASAGSTACGEWRAVGGGLWIFCSTKSGKGNDLCIDATRRRSVCYYITALARGRSVRPSIRLFVLQHVAPPLRDLLASARWITLPDTPMCCETASTRLGLPIRCTVATSRTFFLASLVPAFPSPHGSISKRCS